MKTLVSLTEFVISQVKTDSTVNDSFKKDLADIRNYAIFLKQSLTLGMFVPCGDRYENVLKEANRFNFEHDRDYDIYLKTYAEAKEKVLFKGFEFKEYERMICFDKNVIEIFIYNKIIKHFQRLEAEYQWSKI